MCRNLHLKPAQVLKIEPIHRTHALNICMEYTQQQVVDAVKASDCYADVFRHLGKTVNGGSYKWLKSLIVKHGADTSHFLTPKELFDRNRDLRGGKGVDYSTIDDLSSNVRIRAKVLRKFLLSHNKPSECFTCGLSEWLGSPIVLDVDHIDGNCLNNHIDNLQLLCPNCHRQKTIQWTPDVLRQPAERLSKTCKCGAPKEHSSKTCKTCYLPLRRFDASVEEIVEKVRETNFSKAGEHFGVTDNALRKRLRRAGIDPKKVKKRE